MPFFDVRRPASIQFDEPIGAREHSKMRWAMVSHPLVPRDRGRSAIEDILTHEETDRYV